MSEAILLILADAFECNARDAETAAVEPFESTEIDRSYHHGQSDAYADVARRLRRVVEGDTGVHADDV